MKNNLRKFVASGSGQVIAIALIFAFTFGIFNILFDAANDDYPREIVAALIGTIMAAIITFFLLRHQTLNEEKRERNVEVFRRKFDAYSAFVDKALEFSEDYQLDEDEAHELRRSAYKVAFLSSEATTLNVFSYIRGLLINDSSDGPETDLADLLQHFRLELDLEELDEFAFSEVESIDKRLQGLLSDELIKSCKGSAETLFNVIRSAAVELKVFVHEEVEVLPPSGGIDGLDVTVFFSDTPVISLNKPYSEPLPQGIAAGSLFSDTFNISFEQLKSLFPSGCLDLDEDGLHVNFYVAYNEGSNIRTFEFNKLSTLSPEQIISILKEAYDLTSPKNRKELFS